MAMINIAKKKIDTKICAKFICENYSSNHFSNEAYDLIICTHALYTLREPQKKLNDFFRILSPNGFLFLIDLGKILDIGDWRRYLISSLLKEHGLTTCLRVLAKSKPISQQNKLIRSNQISGTYWTHTLQQLRDYVSIAGFHIDEQRTVYRGYSNLIVARKTS